MAKKINKIQIFIDPYGNTLNLWWDDPKKSCEAQEAEHSWDVICLDKNKKAIGLEKLGFFPEELDPIKNLKTPITILLKEGKYLKI
ncbi:hypothetical protein HY750_02475 [Candidatus Kuenenbacteria bacterium]|nr:hypothetical protein [Candidatus Kuenenbacteria bacterium]